MVPAKGLGLGLVEQIRKTVEQFRKQIGAGKGLGLGLLPGQTAPTRRTPARTTTPQITSPTGASARISVAPVSARVGVPGERYDMTQKILVPEERYDFTYKTRRVGTPGERYDFTY
jgi:hypothetical protein